MRVVAVSDLHGELPDIPECDLLLIAGDSCPVSGSHELAAQADWMFGLFRDWFNEQPARHVVLIGGNHDFVTELESFAPDPAVYGAHYLRDSAVTIEGLTIYGFPWIGELYDWAFYRSEPDLKDKVRQIPQCDVLLAHAPPYGVLDEVPTKRMPHVGTPLMAQCLERIKPILYICGHIHEGYGVIQPFADETVVANVSLMDRDYYPINPPQQFNLEQDEGGKWQVLNYEKVPLTWDWINKWMDGRKVTVSYTQ